MKRTILFTSLAFLLNAFAQIPTTGLVVYYPFSGNANDLSGKANTATVSGAVLTEDRFGVANSAYYFNGNSSIAANNSSSFNTDVWAVSAWYNTTNTGSIQRLTNKGGLTSSSTNYMCILMDATGKIYGTLWDGSAELQCKDNLSTNDGKWHHVVYVRDVSQKKHYLYVDGILKTTSVDTYTGLTNNALFTIGKNGPDNQFWTGKIDDIRIYDRTLNSSEIIGLYNEGICYTNISVTETLIINTTISSFNPVTYQNTIKIWPNPTNDFITIDNGNIANLAGYKLKIANSMGLEVFKSDITQQQFNVDLSTWTGKGIYFVHIINAQGATIDIRKIVLQ